MRYCRILRERQAAAQAAILQTMGIESEDIYVQVQGMPATLLRTVPMGIFKCRQASGPLQHTGSEALIQCRCPWLVF